jgi:hypothetical protein
MVYNTIKIYKLPFNIISLYFIIVLLSQTPCVQSQELFDLNTNTQKKRVSSNHLSKPLHSVNKPYKTLPLIYKYRGEEKQGVHYFTISQQKKSLLTIKQGKLWFANRLINHKHKVPQKLSFPSEQSWAVHMNQQKGFAIYIMDQAGQIYISFNAEKGKIHHSSLAAGLAVACAGEMIIYQGKLYYINNRSGHYRPPPAALRQILNELKEKKVDLSSVKIEFLGVDL